MGHCHAILWNSVITFYKHNTSPHFLNGEKDQCPHAGLSWVIYGLIQVLEIKTTLNVLLQAYYDIYLDRDI